MNDNTFIILRILKRNSALSDNQHILYFYFFFFYSYVHTMFGSFLPPSPTPSLTLRPLPLPPTPLLPSKNYFALISNFVEERV
jgi:hypothetical protein